MNSERSVQEALDRYFARQVARVADNLRQTADRIEREGRRTVDHTGNRRHVRAAADVLHEIDTMHGNLPTGALLDAAIDAQTYTEAEDQR